MKKMLKITQVRSVIGTKRKKHRSVMKSLGFRKNYRTLYRSDTPQIRGMLNKVRHLVVWEEIDEKNIPAPVEKPRGFTVLERGARESEAGTAEAEEPGASGDQPAS